LLSRTQPQAPLERDFVRSPYAGSQPVEFYRPEEHTECSAFASARDKLAVHKVGANERGYAIRPRDEIAGGKATVEFSDHTGKGSRKVLPLSNARSRGTCLNF